MNETGTTSGLFNGYSGTDTTTGNWQNIQTALGHPTTATTTITDIPGKGLTLQGNSTINYSNNLGQSTAVTPNQNNMVRQVRVAVFTVKRNKENKIVSAEFTKELWVEIKNGSSVELAVAKELDKDFDPTNTIIKEMYSVQF